MTQTKARDLAASAADTQRMREILTADIDIRIARDGTWYHEGGAIRRKPLVKLFAGILRRSDDGSYILATPVERRRIEVEDAPFVAVEADVVCEGGVQKVVFRTNVDDRVTADKNHPIRVEIDPGTGEPSPYVLVREGLEALIARPVYYQLVEAGEVETCGGADILVLESCGEKFALGTLADDA
jgi:hypothetical protein